MLMRLISTQRIDGCWPSPTEPIAVLKELHDHADSKTQATLKALLDSAQAILPKTATESADAAVATSVVSTCLALALLELAFVDARSQWQLLAAKARAFLRGKSKPDNPASKFTTNAASQLHVTV